MWSFSATLSNKAALMVNISFYEAASSVVFANQAVNIPPQSIKFYIRVEEWPFVSVQNSLGLNIGFVGGSFSSVSVATTADQSLVWVNYLLSSGAEIYGKIYPLAMVDGYPKSLIYSLDENSNVLVKIPYFWSSVEIDPDYSVLVSGSQNGSSSKGSRIAKVVGVSVGVVVAVVITVGVILISIRKRKTKKYLSMKMKALSSPQPPPAT